jgi:hypothetical protein
MNGLLGFFLGALTLAVTVIFSIFYLVIKKYAETMAKLAAEDYYKNKIR